LIKEPIVACKEGLSQPWKAPRLIEPCRIRKPDLVFFFFFFINQKQVRVSIGEHFCGVSMQGVVATRQNCAPRLSDRFTRFI